MSRGTLRMIKLMVTTSHPQVVILNKVEKYSLLFLAVKVSDMGKVNFALEH